MNQSNKLILRACQKPMVDLMSRQYRGNLFASPGTGKTSATLMSLACLAAADGDVFPALVVAPKRVANMVWDDEVSRWSQFKGISVSKILGSQADRKRAVNRRADIYTINYENLAWLHKELGRAWPFKTVIADESTRLKNHRVYMRQDSRTGKLVQVVSGNAQNAAALVRHAKDTGRWYNLTGTPAANSLLDLWGQQWPVDFGRALGTSFTKFESKWFRPRPGSNSRFGVMEPLENAFNEITERLKPTSAVIDAYDYFNVDRPVELDVFVDLPDEVRAQYRKMHKDAVLELANADQVTAVSAGSVLMKCRQIASGCIRNDDGRWHTLHSEKLAAVDEILERINGENLVIAYWFQHDLMALKAKYPDAEVLTAGQNQKDIIDRWNSGKIRILLVHAQSAGHGLSLQHGGRHLCVYTQDWNAEYYAQVIERLGPIRQAQSGYDRLVYIHRLIAKNTWEEAIAAKQKDKLTMDEMIRRAIAME